MTTTLAPAPTSVAGLLFILQAAQRQILDGLLTLGEPVPVTVLADHLGLPQKPVRDHLHRMHPRGFVRREVPDATEDDPRPASRYAPADWITPALTVPVVTEHHAALLHGIRDLPHGTATAFTLGRLTKRTTHDTNGYLTTLRSYGLIEPIGVWQSRTAFGLAVEAWMSEATARAMGPAPTRRRRVFGECANCSCPSQPWEYQTGAVTLADGTILESATIRTAPCRRDQVAVRELLEGLE